MASYRRKRKADQDNLPRHGRAPLFLASRSPRTAFGTDFAPSDAVDTIRSLKIDAIGRSMPTLGVFAAILDEDGRILCERMNYAAHAWTTPGGRVELGESPLDALKREVLEESGLDVVVGELVGVYSKPYKDDIVLFFRARVVDRHPWQPNDEISEMGYFGRDELPMPMGIGATTRIVDALDGVSGAVRVIPATHV